MIAHNVLYNYVSCLSHVYTHKEEWSGMTAFTYFLKGLLSSVGDLETYSSDSSITISWTAPFSLDVTDGDPTIYYSVLIYNVTDEDYPTVVSCTDCINITETHYNFTPDHLSSCLPCHKYNFTVIPYNGAGQGESSQNVSGNGNHTNIHMHMCTFTCTYCIINCSCVHVNVCTV